MALDTPGAATRSDLLARQHARFDVERARRDTPGSARVAHLNNAGANLSP